MPISDLNVSINQTDEKEWSEKGFQKINVNLNKGGGYPFYLWYKQDSSLGPITRVQVSFSDEMSAGLDAARYKKIDRDLRKGSSCCPIYIWYFRGSGTNHTPIVEIDATTDAADEVRSYKFGWERVACDLNREDPRDRIHIWLKRESPTYICDVTATDSYGSDTNNFIQGYIRVDEDTNRGAQGGGDPVFIWFRQTTDSKGALNDLKVSTSDSEYQALQQKNYTPVNVNLNKGTNGNPVYLWFKKGSNDPIKAITLLLNRALVQDYCKAGLTVIEKDLNTGSGGCLEYLCYHQ